MVCGLILIILSAFISNKLLCSDKALFRSPSVTKSISFKFPITHYARSGIFVIFGNNSLFYAQHHQHCIEGFYLIVLRGELVHSRLQKSFSSSLNQQLFLIIGSNVSNSDADELFEKILLHLHFCEQINLLGPRLECIKENCC